MFQMQKFSAVVAVLLTSALIATPAPGQGTLVEVFTDDFSTNPNANGRWTIHRAHPNEPATEAWWSPTEQSIYLTTSVIDHGVAMFAQQTLVASQWEAEFDFRIGDNVHGGADGLVFCFYKNAAAYGSPELGGAIGFTAVSSNRVAGYGIEVDTWDDTPNIPPFFVNDPSDSHIALVQDNCGNHLTWVNRGGLEDGQWHHMRVAYNAGSVGVEYDGMVVLSTSIASPDQRYSGVGFTAATGGGAWAFHQIDNFVLRVDPATAIPLPPRSLTVTTVSPQGVRLRWLDASGNETKFVVERRRGACGWEFLADTSANAQTYLDRQPPSGEELCYRVSALGDLGSSAPSDPACIVTPPVGRQQLLVYVGDPQDPSYDRWVGMTLCSKHFNRGYGTAVIVHGWQQVRDDDQLGTWMLDTAKLISQRFNGFVNVVAWDWQVEAYGSFYQASSNINQQAGYLAAALMPFFGIGYAGPVHLMGHSMGTHVVTVCAGHLTGNPSFTVDPRQVQLTYWDTPDRGIGSGKLDDNVSELRRRGVYVDTYAGIAELGTHHSNLWVNVPYGVPLLRCNTGIRGHSVDNWYRCTIPTNEDPPLYQAYCSDQVFPGTIGFGTSVLLGQAKRRPESPPGPCRDVGTLMFVPVFCLFTLSRPFVFLGAENCQVFVPTQVTTSDLTAGDYWFREDWQSTFGVVNSTEMFFGAQAGGEGGGGGGQDLGEPDVRYTLALDIQSEWDYLSFDYDFTQAVAPTTLSVTIATSETVYPVFQMSSHLVLAEGYLNTGLRDIRQLHGQSVTIAFALRSAQPGMVVYLRNLTFWRDPWPGNRPPVANAGGDQTILVGPGGLGMVVLDGSATVDPDGDQPLQFWWLGQGELVAVGVTPTIPLPPGRYELTLQVRDPANTIGTDTVTVIVEVEYSFTRGDSNADGVADISDAVATLTWLFLNPATPICQDAADANDDNTVDIADPIFTLSFLFLGSVAPPAPFPDAGPDPTPDDLGCNLKRP